MKVETIAAFQAGINSVHWKVDFDEFCKRTGFLGDYATVKWHWFQQLHESLNKFDPETLAKITNVSDDDTGLRGQFGGHRE